MRGNLLKILNLFLSLVVIALGVNFFFWLKAHKKESKKTPDSFISSVFYSPKGSERSFADYSIIIERNLFNLKKMPSPTSSVPSKKPLSLKLKGTVVGIKEFTFCIIQDISKGKEELYQVGDRIQNMEITAIQKDSVILEDGGERIVLYIEEGEEEVKTAASPEPAPFGINISRIEHPSPNRWIVSREDVNQAAKNASQILSEIKVRPYFSGGRMEGFQINEMKETSIATAIGIQKGDIVKKVNGQIIDSPKKIFEFYRNLQKSPVIQLEVDRGGETEVLTYEIKP